MIISYQLKVFSGQSEVSFAEFEHKKLIFSIELEFYQKRSQPPILVTEIQSYKTETKKRSKNVSESILHGRINLYEVILTVSDAEIELGRIGLVRRQRVLSLYRILFSSV